MLDTLSEAGVPDEAFTVVVVADTVMSDDFYELENQYNHKGIESERISRQEL